MTTIEEYRAAVEVLASQKKNFNFHNEGDDYAKVVFFNIFSNARKTVRIAANTLRNAVVDSQEYQDALCSFLGRDNTVLQIIISHLPENAGDDCSTNLYRRLYYNPAYQEGRIHIRDAETPLFRIGETPANFCVADGLMYRIENDIIKRTALCNFGDPSKAIKLEKVFDYGFSKIGNDLDLSQLFG